MLSFRVRPHLPLIAFVFMLVECWMIIPNEAKVGVYASPVLWLLAGLLPAVFIFIKSVEKTPIQTESVASKRGAYNFALLLYTIQMGLVALLFHKLIVLTPINVAHSDIIPALEIYIKRLLNGETVYTPMEDFGYSIFPNYLTMQWLPHVLAAWAGKDYRWVGLMGFYLGGLLVLYRHTRNVTATEGILKAMITPFILAVTLLKLGQGFMASIELLDAGFYLLLADSLFSKNRTWRGVTISLCLLSRFAFVFWLPAYLIIVVFSEGWKSSFKIAGTVLFCVTMLYVIPFMLLSGDFTIFFQGLKYYDTVIFSEWKLAATEQFHHINRGIGFARWYKDISALPIEQRAFNFAFLQKIISLLVLLLGLGYFLKYNFKKVSFTDQQVRLFSLVLLKISLAFFYAFIPVPVPYLFVVPLFLSVVLVMQAFEYNGHNGLKNVAS